MTILYYLTAGNGATVTVESDATFDPDELAETAAEALADDEPRPEGADEPATWTLTGIETDSTDDDPAFVAHLGRMLPEGTDTELSINLGDPEADDLLTRVNQIVEAYERLDHYPDPAEIIKAFIDYQGTGYDLSQIEEAYAGQYDTVEEFGRETFDGVEERVPDRITQFIDFEKYGEWVLSDYYRDDETGHTFRNY